MISYVEVLPLWVEFLQARRVRVDLDVDITRDSRAVAPLFGMVMSRRRMV